MKKKNPRRFRAERPAPPSSSSTLLTAQGRRSLHRGGIPPAGFERVLRDLLLERWRQVKEWGGAAHDDLHVEGEWVTFLLKQLASAAEAHSDPEFRGRLVRIAALAVAAVESFDRRRGRADS